jgi:hypothetical protein
MAIDEPAPCSEPTAHDTIVAMTKSYYFILTGLHLFHVLIGITVLVCLARLVEHFRCAPALVHEGREKDAEYQHAAEQEDPDATLTGDTAIAPGGRRC